MKTHLCPGSRSPIRSSAPSVSGALLLGGDVNSPFTLEKLEESVEATTNNH